MEQFAARPFDWFSDLEPFEKAYRTWQNGTYQQPALFHLEVKMPAAAPFLIAAGAGLLVAEMRRFKPNSPEIVQRLGQKRDTRGQMLFDESFLNHLQRLRFRGKLFAAPEGSVVLPDEPVLIVESTLLQGHLLEFLIEKLVGRSTVAATLAAQKGTAPPASKTVFEDSPEGWAERGAAIGGGALPQNFESIFSKKAEKLAVYSHVATKKAGQKEFDALTQIRRLWRGSEPLADIWLREEHEDDIAAGAKKLAFLHEKTAKTVEFTRFQNLYQPVLLDGHAAFSSPKISYLQQRAARQIEAFEGRASDFPRGWLA